VELPPAIPFEIRCVCGCAIRGVRAESRQFPVCPDCGQVLFVLPLSPYPEVQVAPARVLSQGGPLIAVGAEPAQKQRPPEWRREARRRAKRIRQIRRARLRAIARAERAARFRAFFTRGRLVFMAVTSAVLITLSVVGWVAYREHLREDFPVAKEESAEALKARDVRKARAALARAARAVRVLGIEGAEARQILQTAAELDVLDDWIDKPLDDVLADATALTTEQWARQFAALYQGRSVVIDTPLLPPDPDDLTATGYRLDLTIFAGTEPVRWDLSNFKLVEKLAVERPTRLLFGARIEAIAPEPAGEPDAPPRWSIRFQPASGVLMTSAEALEAAGWPIDGATKALLAAQEASLQESSP
jgi:hypothetical protein